uniref:Uncharacterized protein n=1 Tax=Nelumbo nucifera TaxID=4432 RepID=A0A822XYP6_NELNU|nr:TPA_asm: hypothetical protein HUJ06_028222 [Nelumbo nucifera]
MKLLALLLVLLMVNFSMAVQRKALTDEVQSQEGRQLVNNEIDDEQDADKNNVAGYSGGGINNHHSIPRQYFDNYGSSPKGEDGNSSRNK